MNSRPMTENDFNPDVLNDIKNSIDWAEEKGHMSGKQEGLIEGEKRGIIKGRQEGLIEGEKRGLIKAVRSLLLSGMDIEFIAKATELSIDEINKIKDELQAND